MLVFFQLSIGAYFSTKTPTTTMKTRTMTWTTTMTITATTTMILYDNMKIMEYGYINR